MATAGDASALTRGARIPAADVSSTPHAPPPPTARRVGWSLGSSAAKNSSWNPSRASPRCSLRWRRRHVCQCMCCCFLGSLVCAARGLMPPPPPAAARPQHGAAELIRAVANARAAVHERAYRSSRRPRAGGIMAPVGPADAVSFLRFRCVHAPLDICTPPCARAAVCSPRMRTPIGHMHTPVRSQVPDRDVGARGGRRRRRALPHHPRDASRRGARGTVRPRLRRRRGARPAARGGCGGAARARAAARARVRVRCAAAPNPSKTRAAVSCVPPPPLVLPRWAHTRARAPACVRARAVCMCGGEVAENEGVEIACDACKRWYHLRCLGLPLGFAEACPEYVCAECASGR